VAETAPAPSKKATGVDRCQGGDEDLRNEALSRSPGDRADADAGGDDGGDGGDDGHLE
jgi:hypothetical protein